MTEREHELAYREALVHCGIRYAYIALGHQQTDPALLAFIREYREGVDTLPLLKLNRWLGYIQGTLIAAGLTTVEAERDWTRPLFRPLDFSA